MASKAKIQAAIKTLSKKKSNKKCFDCHRAGTNHVNMTHGTFICSSCAGLHRNFQHRCCSINATTFSKTQQEFFEARGNKKVARTLLAKHRDTDFTPNDSTPTAKMLEYMRAVYETKKWYGEAVKKRRPRHQSAGGVDNKAPSRDELKMRSVSGATGLAPGYVNNNQQQRRGSIPNPPAKPQPQIVAQTAPVVDPMLDAMQDLDFVSAFSNPTSPAIPVQADVTDSIFETAFSSAPSPGPRLSLSGRNSVSYSPDKPVVVSHSFMDGGNNNNNNNNNNINTNNSGDSNIDHVLTFMQAQGWTADQLKEHVNATLTHLGFQPVTMGGNSNNSSLSAQLQQQLQQPQQQEIKISSSPLHMATPANTYQPTSVFGGSSIDTEPAFATSGGWGSDSTIATTTTTTTTAPAAAEYNPFTSAASVASPSSLAATGASPWGPDPAENANVAPSSAAVDNFSSNSFQPQQFSVQPVTQSSGLSAAFAAPTPQQQQGLPTLAPEPAVEEEDVFSNLAW